MAIRNVPLDPAEVLLGGVVSPSKVLVSGGKSLTPLAPGRFAHVQGVEAHTAGPSTSASVTFGVAPKPGNLICVAIEALGGAGLVLSSVIDNKGNVYTIAPSSPANYYETVVSDFWLAYLLIAPSNVGTTITATFSSSITTDLSVWADEFSVPVGTAAAFDKDGTGSGTTFTGNFFVNSLSITPNNSNSLLYAVEGSGSTTASANAPWTQGLIDGTTGSANAYLLVAGSSTPINFTLNGVAPWVAATMAFYLVSNPPTTPYNSVSLGYAGRSVIVEGVVGPGVIPVLVRNSDIVSFDLTEVAGQPVAIGNTGLQQVSIVGSSGAFLDAVITAGTAPVNGLMTLAVNRTTAPSLTTGQSVGLQCDYAGDLFVKPIRRSKTVAATGNIASATPANIIASQGAGIFADLSAVVLTLREGATANVFFGVLISDGTNSYRFNFMSQSATTIQAASPIHINFDPPIPAASAATAWTIAVTSATDSPSVDYICNFVLQKAS